jgi:hypothetical protein
MRTRGREASGCPAGTSRSQGSVPRSSVRTPAGTSRKSIVQSWTTARSTSPRATAPMPSSGVSSWRVGSTSGWRRRRSMSAGVVRSRRAVGNEATASGPETSWRSRSRSARARSSIACTARAAPTSTWAASVGTTLRPRRRISGCPASFSSRASCWLTADGVSPSRSAAATTVPSSTTVLSVTRCSGLNMQQTLRVCRSFVKLCYLIRPSTMEPWTLCSSSSSWRWWAGST